jgi:hypothetical protein
MMAYVSIHRTARHQEADGLDLQVFRCIGAILQFADDHKDKDVREYGMALGGVRRHIRKHMHPADRKGTEG